MVTRAQIVEQALALIGVPFVDQGRDPSIGIDCVGLPEVIAYNLGLIKSFRKANYPPRPNATFLPKIRATELVEILNPGKAGEGDVLVFTDRGEQCHVGIKVAYSGEPGVIHARKAARRVQHQTLASAKESLGIVTHAFQFPELEDA